MVRGAREKPDVPDHEALPVSAGVYCLRPEALERIGELARRLPTVDFARDLVPSLLASGARVIGHRLRGYWRDVGTVAALLTANRDALEGLIPAVVRSTTGTTDADWAPPYHVHGTAEIGAGVKVIGPVVVGPGARIGRGAELAGTVVLPDAAVAPGALIIGGVVAPVPQAIPVGPRHELQEAGLR
jgi:NDP-sugar pyrophosphorylase family protein